MFTETYKKMGINHNRSLVGASTSCGETHFSKCVCIDKCYIIYIKLTSNQVTISALFRAKTKLSSIRAHYHTKSNPNYIHTILLALYCAKVVHKPRSVCSQFYPLIDAPASDMLFMREFVCVFIHKRSIWFSKGIHRILESIYVL